MNASFQVYYSGIGGHKAYGTEWSFSIVGISDKTQRCPLL